MCISLTVIPSLPLMVYKTYFQADFFGKTMEGHLDSLEIDRVRRTGDRVRLYAVTSFVFDDKKVTRNILLLDELHYAILLNYVGRDIPIKAYKQDAIVDFNRLLQSLI